MPISESLVRALRIAVPGLRLLENEPMSAHCSFRIGGPARVMAMPESEEQAAALLRFLRSEALEPVIMGNGTNLLVSDKGLDAVVLCTGAMNSAGPAGERLVRAQAGASMARAALAAQAAGLAGLEFAHGIPGSVGGGVFMNAGAYGGEIKDVLESVRYIDADGELREAPASELELTYRHSALEGSGRLVTSALFRLEPGDREEIAERMRGLMERRRASQPLDLPSAGSTFKRPAEGYAAALIDAAGLKGLSVGGAQVSEKHAGFVVNRGGATFSDVRELMAEIQRRVFESSGVMLEPEVRILGS